MLRPLLLLLMFSFMVTSATAQTLWGDTSLGMSVAEVRRTQPEATDDIPKPGRLNSGAIEKLRLNGVEIEGTRFAASFYFVDDRLTQVTLSSADVPSDMGLRKYQSLTAALKSKYGDELERKLDRGVLGITASSKWASGRTTISISLFSFGTSPASIYIIYNSTLASTADKL